MAELLPEQLHQTSSTLTTTNVVIIPEAAHRRKKRQILDIDSWVQVYTIYMLALRPYHPEYPAWLHYDTEFRRWAAANQYTQWSQIHPQFYAFAFTGRGIAVGWCPICQIDGGNHTYDCPRFTLHPQSSPLPIHPHTNPLQPLIILFHLPQAQRTSHPIVGLAHLQLNGQKLTTASFLTNIKAPVGMGQIVSSSIPMLTATGGILFHPIQPNQPVNPLLISHCLPHNPNRADTLLCNPMIQANTYSGHTSPKISTYCIS